MHPRRRKPYLRGARKQNPETTLQNRIRIALSERGIITFRNNTGVLKDRHGRAVRFGLCVGSSDVIGIMPDGRFLAIEVKCEGKHPTDRQRYFLKMVQGAGGVSGVAHSVQEALEIVDK